MLNQCNFIGRCGKDFELKYTPSGAAVATGSIAVAESWKNKQGEKNERTEWVNFVFWRGLAEIVGKYCVKGQLVFMSGKVQTRSYEDRDGNKKYITEFVGNEMKLLGVQPAQQSDHDRAKSNGYQPQQEAEKLVNDVFNPDEEPPF